MGHATLEVPSGVAMDCALSIAKERLLLQLFCAMLLIEGSIVVSTECWDAVALGPCGPVFLPS